MVEINNDNFDFYGLVKQRSASRIFLQNKNSKFLSFEDNEELNRLNMDLGNFPTQPLQWIKVLFYC